MDASALYTTMLVLSLLLGVATLAQWILWFHEDYQWKTTNSRRLMRIRIFGYLLLLVVITYFQVSFTADVRGPASDSAWAGFVATFGRFTNLASLIVLLGLYSGPISFVARVGRAVWKLL